jgi:hypothetical protein
MLTRENALIQARIYLSQKLTHYGRDNAMHLCRVNLTLGNMEKSLYWLQVALFLHRLQRVA